MAVHPSTRPYWSQVLRALREARGITQDGWAMQIGYGRATVRRWEAGETVPSADAEARIIELCREKALFRRFTDGPLADIDFTPEWFSNLLAAARLDGADTPPPSSAIKIQTPPVQYARSGDVSIAYQVFGSGPLDIVVTPGLVSHREFDWENPEFAAFLNSFASIGRVAILDKRGTGMSDRVYAGTLEERMDDIRAVMDAAGMKRAALFGKSEGGPMSILFAATYPERTQSLILYGAYASPWYPVRLLPDPLPPFEQRVERIRTLWGTPNPHYLRMYAPSIAEDPDAQEWWSRYLRLSASPGAAATLITMNHQIDVTDLLPAVRVPTLVLHRDGDKAVAVEHGRYLASKIPNARYVELEGSDHLPMYGDSQRIIDETRSFVFEQRESPVTDSILATILTIEACLVPDQADAWQGGIRDRYQSIIWREMTRFRGRHVQDEETILVASFDGPSRATRCALAIRDAAKMLDIDVRAGLHIGEVRLDGDRVEGHALQTSWQIASVADPGQALVSSTVTDLVVGSEFTFSDLGTYDLGETPGRWRLAAVQAP